MRQVYRQARRALAAARAEPTVKHLHEWRKHVKYLRYQLTVLQPLWPEGMAPLVEHADHLGELLGEDHDLTVLRQMLALEPEQFGGEDACALLLALIDSCRKEVEEEAMLLGQRLFQNPPPVFARRLKGYWMVWCQLREQTET